MSESSLPVSSLAVYCGSSAGTDPAHARAVAELGAALARAGIAVVYGGGKVGLMGTVADAALAAGGDVFGVIPTSLVAHELAHTGLTHLEVVATMAERKTRMEQLADGFIALPGGAGTLEEFFEALTLQQLGGLTGPVCLYNLGGFWDPLVDMLARMVVTGFLAERFLDALIVTDSPADLLGELAAWASPGTKWRV